MSYNAKNYTEQGGDVTHIGGSLVVEEGGSVQGLPSSPVVVFSMNQQGETTVTLGELWELMHNQGKVVFFIRNLSDSDQEQSVIYLLRQVAYHPGSMTGDYSIDAWDYSNMVGLGCSGASNTLVSFDA